MAEEKEKEQQQQQQEQPVRDRVESALFSRLEYFKENENTITMASVRRLLEEDLGFEKYALDEHKKFIKQFIEQHLYCDDGGSKNSDENVCKDSESTAKEVMESPKKHEKNEDVRQPSSKDEQNMEEDSPIMGLLTSKVETGSPQATEISKSTIKKAIQERADHIRSNSESLTLAGARRLLEEDLGLDKNALEPFKKFINKEIEEVLDSPVVSKSVMGHKKESRPSSEGRSGSKNRHKREVEDKAKPRGKGTQISDPEKSNKLKRSRIENEPNNSSKKSKTAKKQTEENSDDENDGSVSEDGGSQSSAEKLQKKKPISTPVYGKHVEHLKSIIKACGMSVPPSVYKKAKQVPDNKRESFLTKLLEDILSKEGLSSNPTEKEIKEVKKKKERAKELEGIDVSNIVTSSRRRSTSNFMAPPAPIHKRQDGGEDNAKGAKKDNDVRNNGDDKDDKDNDVRNNGGDKDDKDDGKKEEEDEEEEEEEEEDEDDDDDDDNDESENEEINEDDNESD